MSLYDRHRFSKRDWVFDNKSSQDLASLTSMYQREVAARKQAKADIERTIMTGNQQTLRQLSNNYYKISGVYRGLVKYYANMLTLDYLVSPIINNPKEIDKESFTMDYYMSLAFLRGLKIKPTMRKILFHIIVDGIYFGFLREGADGNWLVQDLPMDYCRTRFDLVNGLHAVEFDVRMFDKITDAEEKILVLSQFPKEIQKAYLAYIGGSAGSSPNVLNKNETYWVLLPSEFAVCFYVGDMRPMFINSIPELITLKEYRDLELQKDKNEASFLLTHKLPIGKDGELIFSLEESKALHTGIVQMLKDVPSVHALTSFADVAVEGLQSNRQTTKDNLQKAERTPYIEASVNRSIFSGEGNTSLQQSIKFDESVLFSIAEHLDTWLTFQNNLRSGKQKDYFFLISILHVTHYNRSDMVDMYMKGATSGYSKLLPVVASGVAQDQLSGLVYLENEILDLPTNLIPLQTSNTLSGDLEEGGRPEMKQEKKNTKTIKNQETGK